LDVVGTTDPSAEELPPAILFKSGDSVLIPTLRDVLTADPDEFVMKYTDIAAVNLACAEGISSSQPIDIPKYLAVLDAMAAAVPVRIEKTLRLFKLKPAEFGHSMNVFRIMTMEHVMRIGFGVKYDGKVKEMTAKEKSWVSDDSSEIFIHGILSEKRTGTCSSLPVCAIAVGRRCGYPLYLVRVPHHCLYRWHDEREQFNYQHNDGGGRLLPDAHYHAWPHQWEDIHFAMNAQIKVWLHSLTAKQEVSKFLCHRAILLRDETHYDEALDAIRCAGRFDPRNPACSDISFEIEQRMLEKQSVAIFGEPREFPQFAPVPSVMPSGNFPVTIS
jgi:hypothetical protein